MTSSPHIPTDSDPGQYTSDPPTSGLHYAEEAQARFPVVVTSWGRRQRFETFDAEQARTFYRSNLNRSPEPNAP